MKNKTIPDFLIRAAKTFVQALIPVFGANWAAIQSHIVAWDFSDWKGWLLPIIISAVSAGIAAVWNLIIERINNKTQLHILEEMTSEEITQFIEQIMANKEENALSVNDNDNNETINNE